jgi:hypothetical protein
MGLEARGLDQQHLAFRLISVPKLVDQICHKLAILLWLYLAVLSPQHLLLVLVCEAVNAFNLDIFARNIEIVCKVSGCVLRDKEHLLVLLCLAGLG